MFTTASRQYPLFGGFYPRFGGGFRRPVRPVAVLILCQFYFMQVYYRFWGFFKVNLSGVLFLMANYRFSVVFFFLKVDFLGVSLSIFGDFCADYSEISVQVYYRFLGFFFKVDFSGVSQSIFGDFYAGLLPIFCSLF